MNKLTLAGIAAGTFYITGKLQPEVPWAGFTKAVDTIAAPAVNFGEQHKELLGLAAIVGIVGLGAKELKGIAPKTYTIDGKKVTEAQLSNQATADLYKPIGSSNYKRGC